jgi:hypothetical protein
MARWLTDERGDLDDERDPPSGFDDEPDDVDATVDDEEEVRPKKGKKKPEILGAPKRPSRKGPLKAYWGVFSESLKQVALFDHANRDDAERRAAELNATKKAHHFVQLVKKEIER